ncbi:MAG TPA: LuxR C-terminal-related transcriptional regulator [Anaerolineaceae bacterium]|nr:LuxR C-terminal-related transcriptional regulator [Anaerolineaceae bacterium]
METTLLKTKLNKPKVHPDLVQRSRLLNCLDKGLGQKLTVISAPAGYGKTTLLSAWATSCVCPIAWLSLDEGDNNLTRFLVHVIASLRTIEPNLGTQILTLVQSPQPTKIDDLVPILLNQLDDVPGPYALVWDDYHLITSTEVHRLVAFILEHQPEVMHLYIATRVDPPLPIAQMRARGQLNELRQADLRFTDNEAQDFLRKGVGIDIAADDIVTLMERTEGWVAGLQLAALSIRNQKDISRLIADFGESHEYIVDYFASEILSRQTDLVKNFLLKTCILQQMCGPLCDALTGQTNGQQILIQLREANLFTIQLDNERCWYRYHHLFGGLLRKQLQQEMPEAIPELHRRASQWYEEHQLPEQAFEHARSAGDQDSISRLVDIHIYSLWSRGEFDTMKHWINSLTEEQLLLRLELKVIKVVLMVNDGSVGEALKLLESTEQLLENQVKSAPEDGRTSLVRIEQAEQAHLHALLYVARALITSLQENPQMVLSYAPQALAVLEKERPRDIPWLSYLYISISNVHLQLSNWEAATDYLSRALELGIASNNYDLALTAMTKKAVALWAQGHINQAALVCQEGLRYIEQQGLVKLPIIDSLLVTWGFILCERGELDQSAIYIQHGLELSQSTNHVYVQAWAYQEMIRLLISTGDLQSAEAYLQQFNILIEHYDIPPKFVLGTAGLQILILILQGKLSEAEKELRLRGIRREGEIDFPNHYLYLCLARLLLAKGNYDEAEKILDRLYQVCQSADQVAYLITIYKIRALLRLAKGEIPLAIESLGKALELAEPEGYIQTFLDEGKTMARLIHEYIRRKGGTEFSRNLLLASQQRKTFTLAAHPGSKLVEPLSEREEEVLALLAEGLSNQEIATKLYLSLRTIKFHTGNIYNKLGVKSRSEAVSRARKLGLLSW